MLNLPAPPIDRLVKEYYAHMPKGYRPVGHWGRRNFSWTFTSFDLNGAVLREIVLPDPPPPPPKRKRGEHGPKLKYAMMLPRMFEKRKSPTPKSHPEPGKKKWRKPSRGKFFYARLKREGVYEQYREERRKMHDNGARNSDFRHLEKKFRFTSHRIERLAHYVRRTEGDEAAEKILNDPPAREDEQICEAMRRLPNQATHEEEFLWVGAHPAMMRRSVMSESDKKKNPFALTLDDILNMDSGPAPSKQAVNMLQHFVNRQDEFFNKLISVQAKKQEKVEQEKPVVVDPQVLSIEEHLKLLD